MPTPLISVVIPCYNQGTLLLEALESLESCDPGLFETIIVNDGSTDEDSNLIIKGLDQSKYTVIWQPNDGLGNARNKGISRAKGTYILPLDADNKIRPNYMAKSLDILQSNPNVAVVYGDMALFGAKTGVIAPGAFNLQKLMLGNFIDACAVIRKSVLDEVGCYDSMKIMGYEDWDLWLRIAFKGHQFHYLNEVVFDYRVLPNSMMRSLNADIKKQNEIEAYLINKFRNQLNPELLMDFFNYKMKKRPFGFIYRILLKKFFPKHYQELIASGRIRSNYFTYNT